MTSTGHSNYHRSDRHQDRQEFLCDHLDIFLGQPESHSSTNRHEEGYAIVRKTSDRLFEYCVKQDRIHSKTPFHIKNLHKDDVFNLIWHMILPGGVTQVDKVTRNLSPMFYRNSIQFLSHMYNEKYSEDHFDPETERNLTLAMFTILRLLNAISMAETAVMMGRKEPSLTDVYKIYDPLIRAWQSACWLKELKVRQDSKDIKAYRAEKALVFAELEVEYKGFTLADDEDIKEGFRETVYHLVEVRLGWKMPAQPEEPPPPPSSTPTSAISDWFHDLCGKVLPGYKDTPTEATPPLVTGSQPKIEITSPTDSSPSIRMYPTCDDPSLTDPLLYSPLNRSHWSFG